MILEHPVCQRPGQLGNRYSGLGGGPPYAKFLDELKAAGYEGTELGPYGYLPADATELKDQLEQEIPVNQLHLRRDEFHGEWNYEILPRKTAQHGNAIY